MRNAGREVTLAITTDNVSMTIMNSGQTLMNHSMEEISFASGGDAVSLYLVLTFYLPFTYT